MGNHPSVKVNYFFPGTDADTLLSALQNAVTEADGFSSVPNSGESYIFDALYTTPAGWIDRVTFQIENQQDGCVAKGYSSSTSICCGWCGPVRLLGCCLVCYSDHGQNQKHLEDIITKLGLDFQRQFISKSGFSKYS
eukprot:TRINITY_DN166_c4_g1_i1.p1 TRINITY_DN166_c4_g1~~TRINITY_DN166_c4_g1_i1.p1  ORF type:complete len:137 (+),score=67.64 TRINITY_DN166_c4_g1_i1:114-524(+)